MNRPRICRAVGDVLQHFRQFLLVQSVQLELFDRAAGDEPPALNKIIEDMLKLLARAPALQRQPPLQDPIRRVHCV